MITCTCMPSTTAGLQDRSLRILVLANLFDSTMRLRALLTSQDLEHLCSRLCARGEPTAFLAYCKATPAYRCCSVFIPSDSWSRRYSGGKKLDMSLIQGATLIPSAFISLYIRCLLTSPPARPPEPPRFGPPLVTGP